MQDNHCALADGTNKIWNFFGGKQRLCLGCLGKGYEIDDCKVKTCGQWMYREAKPISSLRKRNERGQLRGQRKRNTNQSR